MDKIQMETVKRIIRRVKPNDLPDGMWPGEWRGPVVLFKVFFSKREIAEFELPVHDWGTGQRVMVTIKNHNVISVQECVIEEFEKTTVQPNPDQPDRFVGAHHYHDALNPNWEQILRDML